MRLFIGFRPSDEAVAHAAEAVVRISPTASAIRWVPPVRWHITCAFLGEVPADRVDELAARLDLVCQGEERIPGVHLRGAGTFRGVLWLGVAPAAPHSRLDDLAGAIQRGMREEGIRIESRPWRAHVTIARWRPSTEPDHQAHTAAHALEGYAGPAFEVDRIHLVHSVAGPESRYTDLHTSPLSGHS